MIMGNFNKNQKIYDVKKTIFNTDEDDVYYEDLFFISEAQDIPENDSIGVWHYSALLLSSRSVRAQPIIHTCVCSASN